MQAVRATSCRRSGIRSTPLSYIGWGKSTQLGYGLGLTMGAKVAHPDKLCVNFWGDAAIGMTGMDFETCVRAKIPIMSILSNNFAMATEDDDMVLSRQKYGSTDISGNYSDFATAMGGYGERVTDPDQVLHALVHGIREHAGRHARAARVHHDAREDVLDELSLDKPFTGRDSPAQRG